MFTGSFLEYITAQVAFWGIKGVQGDYREDGVVWVDVEFPNLRTATAWLQTVSEYDPLFPEMPAIIGDLRDPVASVNDHVVLQLTVRDREDTSKGKSWSL